MHRCLVAVCCSVGWKIEVNVLNMICKWKELLWVVTLAHDMCVVLLLQGNDFAGNFTSTTHTHWFPTLYNLCPSCKPHHLYLVTN
jgi:hypothetical protein